MKFIRLNTLTSQQTGKRALFALIILLPIIVYFTVMHTFSVNVPYWDDYGSILNYSNAPESVRVAKIFSQHNEHRYAFTRILMEILRKVSGELDLRILIYIGNFAVLAIFIVLFQIFDKKKNLAFFLPTAYLLFYTQSWSSITWATTSLNNYVAFFSLSAFYFWSRNKLYADVLALLSAVLAVYSLGNGLAVFPTLVIWEFSSLWSKREAGSPRNIPLRAYALLISAVLMFYFYLNGYVKPAGHPSIIQALLSPHILFAYFCAFVGSYLHVKWIPVIIGVGVVKILVFIFLTYKKYNLKNPVIYYFLFFLFSMGGILALSRSGFGVDQAFSSRYKLFSILILILEYLALLDVYYDNILKWGRKIIYAPLIMAMIFNMASLGVSWPYFKNRKNLLLEGMAKWRATGEGLAYPNSKVASDILNKALNKGYYRIPLYDLKLGKDSKKIRQP